MYRHCIYLIIHSIYTYIYTFIRLFLVPCWITMKNDPFAECKCGHLVFLMDRYMECIGAGRVPCSFVGAGYRSDVSRRGVTFQMSVAPLLHCADDDTAARPPSSATSQQQLDTETELTGTTVYRIYIHHILYTTSS